MFTSSVRKYPPQEALSARNQIIDKKMSGQGFTMADAYLVRGEVYGSAGDMPAAIADFSEVVRLMPKRADGYYYRAMAYRQIGDTNRATADFDVAFRLNPKLCRGCNPGDR